MGREDSQKKGRAGKRKKDKTVTRIRRGMQRKKHSKFKLPKGGKLSSGKKGGKLKGRRETSGKKGNEEAGRRGRWRTGKGGIEWFKREDDRKGGIFWRGKGARSEGEIGTGEESHKGIGCRRSLRGSSKRGRIWGQ